MHGSPQYLTWGIRQLEAWSEANIMKTKRHLRAAAVTRFISLSDAIPTHRVSDDHGGLIVEAASQVKVVQSIV